MEANEGYIKFQCHWDNSQKPQWCGIESFDDFQACRSQLIKENWIGEYTSGPYQGIGFGNLSLRAQTSGFSISKPPSVPFHITGSATGGFNNLELNHTPIVTEYHIDKNEVHCLGGTKASSETMSHATIYDTLPEVNAILHIHDKILWDKALEKKDLPSTHEEIPYGTPAMAHAIKETLPRAIQDTNLPIIIMKGHEEGIIAYDISLLRAYQNLSRLKQMLLD